MDKPIMGNGELTNEDHLKNFLLDIDCLNELSPWANKFNLFDVLKISKAEIRHSNMLGWLLDPNENHNLKDHFLRGLMEKIAQNIHFSHMDIFDLLLMDYYDFKIYREWKNIDLLLVSDKNQLIICIENKVYSQEHDNQLNRYKQTVQEQYVDYTKLFLFLTPQGERSSDADTWINISYLEIINLLENTMSKTTLSPDAELLIKNYIDTVRWHIVGDDHLIKICNDIYRKHKKALDLIYENKLDHTQEVTNSILEHLLTVSKDLPIQINGPKCSKSYIRFTSDGISKLLPDHKEETSGWKTYNHYFYEITNKGGSINLQLSLSRGNLTNEECDMYFKNILETVNVRNPKPNWVWKIIKSWNILKYSNDEISEDMEQTLAKKIDETLAKIFVFEQELTKKISEKG